MQCGNDGDFAQHLEAADAMRELRADELAPILHKKQDDATVELNF